MGRVAQVDPDQLAALRRLRVAFGFVEVLEVIDHGEDVPGANADDLFNQDRQESGPGSPNWR
jgi:hypothetical protein